MKKMASYADGLKSTEGRVSFLLWYEWTPFSTQQRSGSSTIVTTQFQSIVVFSSMSQQCPLFSPFPQSFVFLSKPRLSFRLCDVLFCLFVGWILVCFPEQVLFPQRCVFSRKKKKPFKTRENQKKFEKFSDGQRRRR